MSWEDTLKALNSSTNQDSGEYPNLSDRTALSKSYSQLMMSELNELVGEEGDLEDIMKMIEKKFGVKSRIVSSSSSQPVLGFELPIYVSCRMGTKDNPSTTGKFTVRDVGNKW